MKDKADPRTGYFCDEDCDLATFQSIVDQSLTVQQIPRAADIQKNVPLYDVQHLQTALESRERRRALMSEWAWVFRCGPGVVVLKGAYADTGVIDNATAIYDAIIDEERRATGGKADHFAASGANDRVWNSLQKLCLRAPEVFLRYFANAAIQAVCEAWLGPNYQMTAQVNLVHPGGQAQQAHRDYHLGFQTADTSADYPAHVHDISAALTLQGAIAHCDMPPESGPTKLLPFSQLYRPGYLAWRHPDFRAHFETQYVQLPLSKGDAVFFNPAVFHAAGANFSADIRRMANLLQVSSAFGRAMESIDRAAMCKTLYPSAMQADGLTPAELSAAIAACAEGYPFPTNLDTDPPAGGLAPESQKELFHRALAERLSPKEFTVALEALEAKRRP